MPLVGSVVVVEVPEGVELGLELDDTACRVEGGEVFLEGLVEAFELAAGLGVVGAGGDLVHAEGADPGLEDDFEAELVAGEYQAVVGDQPGWGALVPARLFEHGRGVFAGHSAIERDQGRHEPGVVIDEIDDLETGPARRGPLSHVALPQVVGTRPLETPP